MKTKKTPKLTVTSLISFGGGFVIFSIGCKMLHFAWAENMIAAAFFVEAILFIAMGFQYVFDAPSKTEIEPTISSSGPDNEAISKLVAVIEEMSTTSKTTNQFIGSLVNKIGLDELSESIKKSNAIAGLDLTEIDKQLAEVKVNLRTYNEGLVALNKVQNAQLSAFKIL
jgi:hypothetical protein